MCSLFPWAQSRVPSPACIYWVHRGRGVRRGDNHQPVNPAFLGFGWLTVSRGHLPTPHIHCLEEKDLFPVFGKELFSFEVYSGESNTHTPPTPNYCSYSVVKFFTEEANGFSSALILPKTFFPLSFCPPLSRMCLTSGLQGLAKQHLQSLLLKECSHL